MNLYLGDLKDDVPSWDFRERDGKYPEKITAFCTGKNDFTNYCNIQKFKFKKTPQSNLTIYGDGTSLTESDINFLETFPSISLRIAHKEHIAPSLLHLKNLQEVDFSDDLIKQIPDKLQITRKAKIYSSPLHYNLNFMGPTTTSLDKGILITGVTSDNFKGVLARIRHISTVNNTKTLELFLHNPDIIGEELLELKSLTRAANMKLIIVNLLDHKYFADIFTSSFLVVDLRGLYPYEAAANQYKAIYTDQLRTLDPAILAKYWKYVYFRVRDIVKQQKTYYETKAPNGSPKGRAILYD